MKISLLVPPIKMYKGLKKCFENVTQTAIFCLFLFMVNLCYVKYYLNSEIRKFPKTIVLSLRNLRSWNIILMSEFKKQAWDQIFTFWTKIQLKHFFRFCFCLFHIQKCSFEIHLKPLKFVGSNLNQCCSELFFNLNYLFAKWHHKTFFSFRQNVKYLKKVDCWPLKLLQILFQVFVPPFFKISSKHQGTEKLLTKIEFIIEKTCKIDQKLFKKIVNRIFNNKKTF